MQIDNDTQHIPSLAAPRRLLGRPRKNLQASCQSPVAQHWPTPKSVACLCLSPPLPSRERQTEADERGCSSPDRTVNFLSVCTQSDPFGRAFRGFIKLNHNIGDSTAPPQSAHLASKENILPGKRGKTQVRGLLAQTHFMSCLDYAQEQSQYSLHINKRNPKM